MPIRVMDYFPETVALNPEISFQIVNNKKFSQIPRDQKEFISFEISGNLKGSIIACSDSSLSDLVRGVLVEALNIVIGKTISSIEEEAGFIMHLNAPKIEKDPPCDISAKNTMFYQLKLNHEVINCFLFHDLQQQVDLKLRTSPVIHENEGVTNV